MKTLRELVTSKAERHAKRDATNAQTQAQIVEHQQRMQQQRHAAMIHTLARELRALKLAVDNRQS